MGKSLLRLALAALVISTAGLAAIASAAEYELKEAIAFEASDGSIVSMVEISDAATCGVVIQFSRHENGSVVGGPYLLASAVERPIEVQPTYNLGDATLISCNEQDVMVIETGMRLMLQ